MTRQVDGVGWIALWTFLTFLNTCSTPSREDIRELKEAVESLQRGRP